jgi:dihydroorotase/N-acyl-D-amino-acid deacylase
MFREAEPTWKRYGVRADFFTLANYFARFAKAPPTINLGTFVGSGGLRQLVVGGENRRATPAELARMAGEVEKAMKDGALGLSSSLQYVPDIYNSTDEIVAMAKAAARHGGVYFVHQRSESNAIDASLGEVFRVAREAAIPANVWHLKTAYRRNWGRMPAVLARLEAARAEGLDVAANQYPWTAASNPLDSCLPPWMREGGKEKLLARLKDAAQRERAKADMARDADDWQNQYFGSGGPSRIIVSTVLTPSLKSFEGKTVEEIAAGQKKDPRDALMDVVLADGGRSSCIFFCMDEEDVKSALKHRLVSFCTDSGASATDGILSEEKSHPRGWASTARILGTYVRDEKVLPLEEAVRKMTSFAAARAGLKNRGLLKEGFPADLVAFDLAKVKAVSTYADPLRYSEGFPYVAVNGALVVDGGRITSERPGRALRGPGFAR